MPRIDHSETRKVGCVVAHGRSALKAGGVDTVAEIQKEGDAGDITIFHFLTKSLLSQGVRSLLGASLGFKVLGEADSLDVGVPLIEQLRPDVVLCGIIPGHYNPVEVISALRKRGMSIPVLVLTSKLDAPTVTETIRAPIAGYLWAGEVTPGQLDASIRAVKLGIFVLSPSVQRLVSEAVPPTSVDDLLKGLTDHERRILELMIQGMGSSAIAAELSLSVRSVQLHTNRLLGKLGVHSRMEAVTRVLQRPAPLR